MNGFAGLGELGRGIGTVLFYVVLAAPFIFLIYIIWFRMQFKHAITLKKRTAGSTKIVVRTTFRIIKNKDEGDKIQTWRPKLNFDMPSSDCLEILDNGKLYAEGDLDDNDQVKWRRLLDPVKADKAAEELRYTAADKFWYFNRDKMIKEKWAMPNLWSVLQTHGGGIIFFLILACLCIFAGDLSNAYGNIQNKITSQMSIQDDITSKQLEITKTQADITRRMEMIINERSSLPNILPSNEQLMNITGGMK